LIESFAVSAIYLLVTMSCEVLDDDVNKHTSGTGKVYVSLSEVAEILAALPLEQSHMEEVHSAASGSMCNGYDEEYTMRNLFDAPGCGVGDDSLAVSKSRTGKGALMRDLIAQHVHKAATKASSGGISNPESFLEALSSSDIQIYWPFSEDWDGQTLPIITFDPQDGSDANVGYRLFCGDDGSRHLEEVMVDEEMASKAPVWVVNRNSDAEYTTLEMLRRDDPAWGEGGGAIIIKPDSKTVYGKTLKTLVLKEFIARRNFDSWFAGASEYFVKAGSLDDFTASTEAELRLYNPMVTDFMIVVRRSQVGKPQPFNAVLVSDWNPQMTHCAFMITEDDGGTRTEWKCTALVRIASKSYGVEINLPFNSRDDIVWRGHLTNRWLEANSGKTGHFGDVDLTFEVVEY
jgi:hypothetical protein